MLNNTLKKYPGKNIHKYVNTVISIPEHMVVTYSHRFSSWYTQYHSSVWCLRKSVHFMALLLEPQRIYMVRHRQRQAHILAFMSFLFQVYFVIFCCVQVDNIGELQSYLGYSSPSKHTDSPSEPDIELPHTIRNIFMGKDIELWI